MAGQTPPVATLADPDLCHRHPERRGYISVGQHDANGFGIEDGRVARDHDVAVAELLRSVAGGLAVCLGQR